MKKYKITAFGSNTLHLPMGTIIEAKLPPTARYFKPMVEWVEEIHDAFMADDESNYWQIHQAIKEINRGEGMSEDQALRGADGSMKDFLTEIAPEIKKLNI